MFRLPVCPHCHTVYHYRDVRRIKSKKEEKCYHCGKSFKVSKLGYIVLFLITAVLTVVINLLILNSMPDIRGSMALIVIISLIAVTAALIFTPYFILFKRSDGR